MKLRNKNTGEIFELDKLPKWLKETIQLTATFYSRECEVYEPKEPLIKDEKILKAVRAWAEANKFEKFIVTNEHFNCCKIIGRKDNRVSKIEFQTTIANATHRPYTIAELCGEEE